MPHPTDEEIAILTERISKALGPDVKVACAAIDDRAPPPMAPEEAVTVAKAVPQRVAEFATGRALARRLVSELGFAPRPIVSRKDRSPDWPAGAIGSITHTKHIAIVAAARGGPDASLGIDVEPRETLNPELYSLICTPQEIEWLDRQPAEDRGRIARTLFSAKETLYKCQHPITTTFLGFQQAEIDFTRPERFEARILHPVAARFGDEPPVGFNDETGQGPPTEPGGHRMK
ncbi:MAG: 4'-phosphopantetheinyl transferase superfamily protein, partial [Myxococcota bacterium]